jgi:hypothetical protein
MARSMVRAHPNSVGPSGNLNVRFRANNADFLMSALCLLMPQERRQSGHARTSHSCHFRKSPANTVPPRPSRLVANPSSPGLW